MVAVAGGLSLLSACGSSGGAAETATLSRAQFLNRANAICAEGIRRMGRLDEAAWRRLDPTHRDVTEAISNQVALALLPVREDELRRIRALGLPRGHQQYVETMLTAWEKGIEKGKADPPSLQGTGSHFAFYRAYTMGIRFGLVKCWLS